MQEVIVKGYSHFPINIAIVWTNMLPLDDEVVATSSARLIQDPRAQHFYDPNALAGKAIAASLGSSGTIAWDIYLFFSYGLQWHQHPPTPVDWAHQLSDSWADIKHFYWNRELVHKLDRVMAQQSRTKPPDK